MSCSVHLRLLPSANEPPAPPSPWHLTLPAVWPFPLNRRHPIRHRRLASRRCSSHGHDPRSPAAVILHEPSARTKLTASIIPHQARQADSRPADQPCRPRRMNRPRPPHCKLLHALRFLRLPESLNHSAPRANSPTDPAPPLLPGHPMLPPFHIASNSTPQYPQSQQPSSPLASVTSPFLTPNQKGCAVPPS